MNNPPGGWQPGPPGPGQQPGYGAPQGYAPQPGYGAPQQAQGYAPQGPQAQGQAYAPQPGYGAPPGYPQPGAMVPAAPGVMAAPGGPSAFGVPLEPGERVIYCNKPSYTVEKVIFWIFGVMMLVILIGIIFIVMALRVEKTNPRAVVITNRRLIVINGNGQPQWMHFGEIADVTAERQKSNAGGGGLVGALVSAAVTAVANSMADKNAKFDKKYWARTIAFQIAGHNGSKLRVPTKDAQVAGPFLAQCLWTPGFAEHQQPVACDP